MTGKRLRSVALAFVWASFAWASMPGCGYSAVRTDVLFGQNRIAVRAFDEDVPVGVSADLTAELRRRLADGGVQITDDPERAGASLAGTIVASTTAPSPTTAGLGARVTSYRVSLRVSATLRSASGQSLWSGTVDLFDDFLPPSGSRGDSFTLRTDTNRRRALRRLAEEAARQLHEHLVIAAAR